MPKGVRSVRAQMPLRLGTTTKSRPSPVKTRQISRSMARRYSLLSSPWTSNTLSTETSGKGSSVSSAKATAPGPSAGQCTTPWVAGISAITRSASPPI